MEKVITITNGSGSAELINDTYSVVSNTNGYDNTSIEPSSVTITNGVNSYAFTIGATGTLTIHVTEDGTSTGTPVVGASFIRTDSSGNEYGSAITTDSNGDAVFNNVPFAASNPPTIYFKEQNSDGAHEFVNTVQNTTLTSQTATVEVENAPGATRTITLTDANYTNLPIESGSLTVTGSN